MARVRLVLAIDGRVAVIRRWREDAGHYAVLPGGGVEPDETMEEAAAREAMEELGLVVRVGDRLGADEHGGEEHVYLRVEALGGTFGTGTGDEYDGSRDPGRGTYEPALADPADLASVGLRPDWLIVAVPAWLSKTTGD